MRRRFSAVLVTGYCDSIPIFFQRRTRHLDAESKLRFRLTCKTRLTKMHAKALTSFNFFNFHPVSTKFPINIEHVILTNRMFFVFRNATFLAGK